MHIIANNLNNYTSSFKDISVIRLANTNTTTNYQYGNAVMAKAHSKKKSVAGAFMKSSIPQVSEAGQDMLRCGSHPQHIRIDGKAKGFCNIRCHQKLCFYCASMEAMIRGIQWQQATNGYVKQKGKVYVYFLTLTVRNCEVADVGQVLTNMNKALKKFQDRIFFRREIGGWMKGTEITNSKFKIIDTHPHFHIILLSDRPLEEAYLEYIDESKEDHPTSLKQYFFREWQDCLGASEIVAEEGQDLRILPVIKIKIDAEILSCLGTGRLAPDEQCAGAGMSDELAYALIQSGKLDEEMVEDLNLGKGFDERKLLELKIKEEMAWAKEAESHKKINYIVKYVTKEDDVTKNPEWAANLMVNIRRRRFHAISQNLKALIPVHDRPELTKNALLLSGRNIRLKRHDKAKFYDCIVTQNNAVFTLDCEETLQQKRTGQSLHQAIKNGCLRLMLEQADHDPEKWLNIIDYAFASLHGLPEAGYMSRHVLQEWMDSTIYREEHMSDELWNMVDNMTELMKQTGLKTWEIIGTPHPDIALPLDEDQQYGLTLIRQGYDAIQKRYTEVQRAGYFDETRYQQEAMDDIISIHNQISNITYELINDELELGETNLSSEQIETLKKERTSATHMRSSHVQRLTGLTRVGSKERFEAVAELHQTKTTMIEPMTAEIVGKIESRIEEIAYGIADLVALNKKRGGHISNDDKAILKAGRAKIKKLRKYLREHPNFRPVADACEFSLEMLPPKEEPILHSLSHEVPYPFLPHAQGKHDWSECFGEAYTEQATNRAEAEAELMAYKAMCKSQKWNTLAYGTNKKLMAKDDIDPRGGLVPTTCYPTTAELRFSGIKDSATMEEVTMALFDEQAIKAKVSGKRIASWNDKQAKRRAKGMAREEAPANLTLRDPADMNFAVFDWTADQAFIKNATKALEKQEYTATVMRVDRPDANTGWSHETSTGDSFTTWRRNRGKAFNGAWFAEHAIQVSVLIEVDGRAVATKFYAPATMKEQWQGLMGKAITKAHKMTLQQCLDRPPVGQRLEPN